MPTRTPTSAGSPTAESVAARYFEALVKGDAASALSLLSADVVWHQGGANRFSGEHHGRDQVAATLAAMMKVGQGSFRLYLTGPLMVNGQHVAAPVHFSAQRPGARMDMDGVDVVKVRGGQVCEVRLFSADAVAEDEFLGQA